MKMPIDGPLPRSRKRFQGVVVPLATPATPDGGLDTAALEQLVDRQAAAGVDGVLVLGTMGEGPSVPRSLRARAVRAAVNAASGRIQVHAGIGDNALEDALVQAREARKAGADAVVAFPPSYFPAAADALAAFFGRLLDQVELPLLLYNIPATTHISIPLEVLEILAGHPRLAGVKDSENSVPRQQALFQRLGGSSDFSILVGTTPLMASGLEAGADGVVPSVGNLLPEECRRFMDAARLQDWAEVAAGAARLAAAAAHFQQGRDIGQAIAALKALMASQGLCNPHPFPPLLELAPEEQARISLAWSDWRQAAA